MTQKPTISFEYFPPKNEKMASILWEAAPKLASFEPRFMTVTYGAGGSTKDGTVKTLERMIAETGIPMAAHLTFINTTKEELQGFTQELWDMGVKHLIALRGDMPADSDVQWPLENNPDYFQYTSDFVEGLKQWNDFEISVGCYPEKHPDAPNMDADIAALKLKCDAGSDRAITQFFFDNDVYYRFRDQSAAAGIATPIIPGLVPVHNFKGTQNFASKCQAGVPDWVAEKFAGHEEGGAESDKIATELLVSQTEDLAANGVEHFHFYCMNRANITSDAVEALGYRAKAA